MCRLVVQRLSLFFFGKLGQVTSFTIVGGTVLYCYCLLGGKPTMLGRLHARLCRTFLVESIVYKVSLLFGSYAALDVLVKTKNWQNPILQRLL